MNPVLIYFWGAMITFGVMVLRGLMKPERIQKGLRVVDGDINKILIMLIIMSLTWMVSVPYAVWVWYIKKKD